MQFLGMLMPLLGLVSFAAYVWLVVVAFKRSVGWGLLVLFFSPITAIIFAIKFWPEPKRPFLVYVGSFSAYCAILLMFVVFLGGSMFKMAMEMNEGEITDERAAELMEEQMDRMEASGLMSAEDKAQMQEIREELRATDRQDAEPGPATLAAAPASVEGDERDRRTPTAATAAATSTDPGPTPGTATSRNAVPVREIGNYVGERLHVTMRDGRDFVGRLVAEDGDALEFEQRISAGTMTVYVTRDEIRSVEKRRLR